MKRLWISVVLLAALLTGSLLNARYADQLTSEMQNQLLQAQNMAEQGNWEDARSLTQQVYDRWQSLHFYLHSTMRHSDTDQILRGFRSVLEYLELKEPDQYNAANEDLVTQLELLSEMEQPSVVNVL